MTACNGNQGSCSYCGTKGLCCTHKSGWTDTSNGCDGSFGGTTTHLCSVRKTEGMICTDIFQFSQQRLIEFLEHEVNVFYFVSETFCADEKDCLPTETCQLKSPSEREIVSGKTFDFDMIQGISIYNLISSVHKAHFIYYCYSYSIFSLPIDQ